MEISKHCQMERGLAMLYASLLCGVLLGEWSKLVPLFSLVSLSLRHYLLLTDLAKMLLVLYPIDSNKKGIDCKIHLHGTLTSEI